MPYAVGQKVCLWQEEITKDGVFVLKEVIVTITEAKTGVLGEFSRQPVKSQSLCGVGDDGKIYEKHWESWPESQSSDFIGQWSLRDDGEGKDRFWIPKEAVYAHNALQDANRRKKDENTFVKRTDVNGQRILPKGDVVHCEEHNEYYYPQDRCFRCLLQEQGA